MDKDRPSTLYEKQKAERPSVLEVARGLLSAELYGQLAGFVEFLRQNQMIPRIFTTNSFQVTYKGETVLRISISYVAHTVKDSYAVRIDTADETDINDFFMPLPDDMLDFYLKNVRRCQNCHTKSRCANKAMVVLGRKVESYCNTGMYICNPTEQQYEYIKKFIMLRREYIKSKEIKL